LIENSLPFSNIAFRFLPERRFVFAHSANLILSSFVSTSSNDKICENRKGQASTKLAKQCNVINFIRAIRPKASLQKLPIRGTVAAIDVIQNSRRK
jgi:hypothetical protein